MSPRNGPLFKIDRAKEHLDALNAEVTSFSASQPYRIHVEKDPQDGSDIFYPYLREPFPFMWGMLIGEIAHALRSALDNIAWAVAVKRDRFTSFPISIKDKADITTSLERLSKDVWGDIDAVQPYTRPYGEQRSHPLWLLSRINNIDKHRTILLGALKLFISTGLKSPKWFWIDGLIKLSKGDMQFKFPSPANLQKDFKPEVTGRIVFDISQLDQATGDPSRLLLINLFSIHYFIRNDVYPRFAHLL